MNVVRKLVKNGLPVVGLFVICWARVSLAGHTSTLGSNGNGQVGADLIVSTTTSNALTSINAVTPSAGVTGLGTWTVKAFPPEGTPNCCTSTIASVLLTGGYKAVANSWTVQGISAGPSLELSNKLATEGFTLTPNLCGSGYTIASGDETINGQRYLVVLGNATGGTVDWFRGYIYNGTPTSRDDIINGGTKLYEAVVLGPFDFGDPNSPDRCNALKIPINYTGPNLYMLSDGAAVSTTDLAMVSCPNPVNLAACNPSYPTNSFTTSGGCPPVTVTFDTDPNSILPGTSATVNATATDTAGNTATCQFTATRTGLQIVCPTGIYALAACSPSYPSLITSGGCGAVVVSNYPPASSIAPGTVAATVTATATDANGTVATCQFQVSRPGLQIVGCPSPTSPYALAACSPSYPALSTSGGCAPVNITFNPASASSIAPGTMNAPVTATATDANGSVATCHFTVSRPALQIVGCPTGPLDFSTCGTPVAYPSLSTSGGCAPVTITLNPANVSALRPGTNNVIATATDANGSVATCQFEVIRPYLSLGSSGYAPPIGGLGGSCTAPLRVNNSGNTLKIAFSTYLCGTSYTTIVPKITITQLDANCNPTKVYVNSATVALINSQWHYNWSTGGNLGYFLITVDLGDGNPNPTANSAIVLMQ